MLAELPKTVAQLNDLVAAIQLDNTTTNSMQVDGGLSVQEKELNDFIQTELGSLEDQVSDLESHFSEWTSSYDARHEDFSSQLLYDVQQKVEEIIYTKKPSSALKGLDELEKRV